MDDRSGEGRVERAAGLGRERPGERADSDRDLVRRIAAGDRQALADLYLRERTSLLRYLRGFTADPGLAEEIAQDTLVAAWQGARRYEGRSAVRTWLLGIARRQAHNTLRRRGLPLADPAALAALPDPLPDPEERALVDAERADLAAALDRLAPAQREVLLLALVHELSYREIADLIGVPPGTVGSRLTHAKRALRALLPAREEKPR